MINYVCAKTVPDLTKLHLIKGPKSKFQNFPREHAPDPPNLPHALHTNTYLPHTPYNLILPLLGQKAERNPGLVFYFSCHNWLSAIGFQPNDTVQRHGHTRAFLSLLVHVSSIVLTSCVSNCECTTLWGEHTVALNHR